MEEEFDTRLHATLSGLTNQNQPEAVADALGILLKLLQNIATHPEEAKFRAVKKTNKVIASKLLSCTGILQILTDVGFVDLDRETMAYQLHGDDRLEQAAVLTEVALHEIRDSLKTEEQKAHPHQLR